MLRLVVLVGRVWLTVPDRSRRRDHGQDPLDHLGRGDVVGHRVEAEHDAVGHHVPGDRLHVGRQHVVAAVDQSQRPGGRDEAERGAGAAADLDHRGEVGQVELRRRTRGQDQADDVLGHQVVHEHVLRLALQALDHLRVEHRAGGRRVDAHPAEDLELLVAGRVGHVDLEQEAVALCLGQRVDALGLDRVLGGDHDERLRHREGGAADGHLLLGHQLEHRGLDLGRRAVDLVGEHEVDEDRAELDVEALLAGLVDPGADDVGRHQVGGELEAGRNPRRPRWRSCARPASWPRRDTLEQDVPLASRPTISCSTMCSWPTITRWTWAIASPSTWAACWLPSWPAGAGAAWLVEAPYAGLLTTLLIARAPSEICSSPGRAENAWSGNAAHSRRLRDPAYLAVTRASTGCVAAPGSATPRH